RRFTPKRSACTRLGSANIISTRSACCRVRTWCSLMSPPTPRGCGWRRRSTCCRCITQSALPSRGRRLTFCPAGRSHSPCGAVTLKRKYFLFRVSFEDNQDIFEEGLELVRELWRADGRISHHGKYYSFDDVRITPQPIQRPLPTYVGSFSKPSIELAARLGCGLIVAPFAAAMSFGGLQ